MPAITPKTLRECDSYKEYLRQRLGRGEGRLGSKASFAKALRCHPAYISQVLNGKSHLSLEQGQQANEFFHHSDHDSHFFLLLIQRERAATPELQAYFSRQLEGVARERRTLSKRIRTDAVVPEAQRATYVSNWLYSALHVAVMHPGLRTVPALSAYLGQTEATVRRVLQFLVKAGLVEEEGGTFSSGPAIMHYGNDKTVTQQFHANWRLRSIQNAQLERKEDMHYSSVICLGKKDAQKAKEILIQAIEEIRKLVKDSPEEELVHYSADFFSLKG